MPENELLNVYNAKDAAEQEAAYDDWASNYERDLFNMGYRLPGIIASVFARYIEPGTGPILDAGCGGGVQVEPLVLLGYDNFIGIDLSEGMLEVARQKKLYKELRQMEMGKQLDFPSDQFAAVISSGTITPGHAPPETLQELIRVCKPGGLIIFSMRVDEEQDPAYPAEIARLTEQGKWIEVYSTAGFQTMPYGEPAVRNCVHVYRAA